MDMMMMMPSYFMFRPDVTILFSGWKSTNTSEMAGTFFGLMILALIYESIKFLRESLKLREKTGMYHELHREQSYLLWAPETIREKMFNLPHFIQTFLHMIQVTFAYMLMLAVMTYNAWVLISIVVGSAMGYFLFGPRRLPSQLERSDSLPKTVEI